MEKARDELDLKFRHGKQKRLGKFIDLFPETSFIILAKRVNGLFREI